MKEIQQLLVANTKLVKDISLFAFHAGNPIIHNKAKEVLVNLQAMEKLLDKHKVTSNEN